MNHLRPPRAVSLEFLAAAAFALLAVVLACTPVHQAPDPTPIYVDASDASALLDVGQAPSECALMCASWAAGQCREATPNCVDVCARETRADGFYSPRLVQCVIGARGDRTRLRACSPRGCP